MVDHCSKQVLCDIVKCNRILLIFDKIEKILHHDARALNKTIKCLVEQTLFTKVIVVSNKSTDIDTSGYKIEHQIKALSELNAAKLLISAAGDAKYMRANWDPKELMKHPIFGLMNLKPAGIL